MRGGTLRVGFDIEQVEDVGGTVHLLEYLTFAWEGDGWVVCGGGFVGRGESQVDAVLVWLRAKLIGGADV